MKKTLNAYKYKSHRKHYKKTGLKAMVKSVVKKEVQREAETKFLYFQSSAGPAGIDNVGITVDLSAISQGANDSQRIGDSVMPSSLEINYCGYSRKQTGNTLRVVIVRWTQDDGNYPLSPSVVLNNNSTVETALSTYVHDYRPQYNVLYDQRHELGYIDVGASRAEGKIKIPIKKKIEYIGGTTDGTNKIYMIVISDDGSLTNCFFQYAGQLNYRDS